MIPTYLQICLPGDVTWVNVTTMCYTSVAISSMHPIYCTCVLILPWKKSTEPTKPEGHSCNGQYTFNNNNKQNTRETFFFWLKFSNGDVRFLLLRKNSCHFFFYHETFAVLYFFSVHFRCSFLSALYLFCFVSNVTLMWTFNEASRWRW